PTENENSRNHLLVLVAFAAMAMFLLFQAGFGSWRLAPLAFLALPTALAGGVVAAAVAGGDVTIGSYAGFLTLGGIAARGAMLMITRCQTLREQPDETFGLELVVRGARERVGPVLMTAFAIAGGLLALMLVGNPFGHEVMQPMAIIILGGLVTSTLFSLFIVPGLYLGYAPMPATAPVPPHPRSE